MKKKRHATQSHKLLLYTVLLKKANSQFSPVSRMHGNTKSEKLKWAALNFSLKTSAQVQ